MNNQIPETYELIEQRELKDIESNYILYNVSYNCRVGENMKLKLRKVVDLFV